MTTRRSRMALLSAIVVLLPALVLGATVSGTLRDGNWDPITEEMEVSIAPYHTEEWTSVTTEDGTYSFTDVAEGDYWMYARSLEEDSWLIPVYYPGIWMPMFVPPTFIEGGDIYENMDFMIEEGGRVSGSVVPAEGGEFPAWGVSINLIMGVMGSGGWTLENPSDFLSSAIPSGMMPLQFVTTGEEDYHVGTFTGNTWNYWDAESVMILNGQVTDIGTIQMELGGAISGMITGEGAPLPGAYANASVITTPFEPPAYLPGVFNNQDGSYLLRGVPAGMDLAIHFQAPSETSYNSEWYDGASTIQSATLLNVEVGELLTGINANLMPGASFFGTITNWDGSTPGMNDWYDFIFFSEQGEENWADVTVEGDGTWATNSALAAGIYTLHVSNYGDPSSLGQYVGDVTWPWEADWMAVGAGEHVGPVDIQLARGGSIRGTLYSPDGEPVNEAEVEVQIDGRKLTDTWVDWDGTFAFDGLPAGEYIVSANYYSEEAEELWPTIYSGNAPIRSMATPILVTPGEISVADLQFQRGGQVALNVWGPDEMPYDPFMMNVGIAAFPITTDGEVLFDVQTAGNDDFFIFDTVIMHLPVGEWSIVAVPVYLDFDIVDPPSVQRTFLGNVDDFANAITFTVSEDSFAEYVIMMDEGGHSISGGLSTVTGHQLGFPPSVVAVDENGMIASAAVSFFGMNTSEYAIHGLANGTYHVLAAQDQWQGRYVSTWYPDAGAPGVDVETSHEWPAAAEPVVVNDADLNGLDIVMQVGSGALGVDPRESDLRPDGYALKPAYPNPFNAATSVVFTIPKSGRVKLELMNVLGQRVATLEDRAYSAGAHRVMVDASRFSSGFYFIRMEAGSFQAVQKLTLIK